MAKEPGTAGGYTARMLDDHFAADVVHDLRNIRGLFVGDGQVGPEYLKVTPNEVRDAIVRRLDERPEAEPAEIRREGALESDPYRVGPFDFAELLHTERETVDFADMSNTDRADMPRRRMRLHVFDDVHATHRMLDALGIAGGPLTARVGLALGWKLLEREKRPAFVHDAREVAARMAATGPRRSHGSGEPLADVDSVKIPTTDEVFDALAQLTGEEIFRVFDSAKVLPGNTAEARNWILTDPADVRRMVAECCVVAVNTERLPELARAVREAVARKAAIK